MAILGLLPFQRFEALLQTCDQPFELIDAFLALSTRPQSGLSAITLSYTEIASSSRRVRESGKPSDAGSCSRA